MPLHDLTTLDFIQMFPTLTPKMCHVRKAQVKKKLYFISEQECCQVRRWEGVSLSSTAL